jgi:hypothetical protein
MTRFKTEKDLVEELSKQCFFIKTHNYLNWCSLVGQEVGGYFGVPDLLFAVSRLQVEKPSFRAIAVEAKLSAWKAALVQAYRYKAFSHYSYVAIDNANIKPALLNIDSFRRSNIGLLSIAYDGALTLHHRPKFEYPYCLNLTRKLQLEVIRALNNDTASSKTSAKPLLRPVSFCH